MPAAKPTSLHKMQGTYRADRHGKRQEPQLSVSPVRMPKSMSLNSQRFWRKYHKILSEAGVLTEGDSVGLEAMAYHYDAMVQAYQDLRERGSLIKGDRGLVKNPSLQILRDSSTALYRWASAFGLTPVSRTKVDASEEDVITDFQAFLLNSPSARRNRQEEPGEIEE